MGSVQWLRAKRFKQIHKPSKWNEQHYRRTHSGIRYKNPEYAEVLKAQTNIANADRPFGHSQEIRIQS